MVHKSARVLKNIVRHLTSGLRSLAHKLEDGLERLEKYDYWRWVLMLGKGKYFSKKFIHITMTYD